MNAEDWLSDVRAYVKAGDLGTLQYLYETMLEGNKDNKEYRINIEWLWQKAYLLSINYRKPHITVWLQQLYDKMDMLDQIALKPTLMYGRKLAKM